MRPASGVPAIVTLDIAYDKEETEYSKPRKNTASQGHSSTGCGKNSETRVVYVDGFVVVGPQDIPNRVNSLLVAQGTSVAGAYVSWGHHHSVPGYIGCLAV